MIFITDYISFATFAIDYPYAGNIERQGANLKCKYGHTVFLPVGMKIISINF